MKLDVEALAREAEVGDSHGHFIRHYLPELESFARLIVDRCAEVAAPERIPFNDEEWRVRCEVSDAIRQLLEDK